MVHQEMRQLDDFFRGYLNTSYVMVHLLEQQREQQQLTEFKYILCYGSSLIDFKNHFS